MADDPKEEIPQIETPENNLDKGEELLSDSPNTINALDLAGQNSEHISLAPSNQHLNVSGWVPSKFTQLFLYLDRLIWR